MATNYYIPEDYALQNFIDNFYEDSNESKKLKNAIKQYNDKNFETVKNKLQQKPVQTGHNVDDPLKTSIIYSDLNAHPQCIFKHIILFTNDKDPKNNKTLKNILDAIKTLEKSKNVVVPELHIFCTETVTMKETKKTLVIEDDLEKIVIRDESNIDTLVLARLSVQKTENAESIVKTLQDRGFFVLNPIEPSQIACNKYETALLLQEHDIPQPNFCLMTKYTLYDEKLYEQSMKSVYKDWDIHDTNKNEQFQVVMKILDGHGGTGVALVDGKKMYAILQMIFAIDPNQNILIQKKEEGDGGDIRVHVLTLRDKQVILGAMKRIKLGGDFRSNVSLGAEAEPIKLTKEQEELALHVALISGLPWCAVDILPLVKGSNKELGDNVVLEINASPGTSGISEVINTNFINILLNELTDPTTFPLQDKIAGYRETVSLMFDDSVEKQFLAKLDTGNSTKATCLEVGEYTEDDNYILFSIDGKPYQFEKIAQSNAKSGSDIHERPIIILPQLTLGTRKINNIPISLVKNRDRLTNVLLNRDTLSKLGYVVHPNKKHVLTNSIKKVKI